MLFIATKSPRHEERIINISFPPKKPADKYVLESLWQILFNPLIKVNHYRLSETGTFFVIKIDHICHKIIGDSYAISIKNTSN